MMLPRVPRSAPGGRAGIGLGLGAVFAAAAALAPIPAATQSVVWSDRSEPGWLGIGYEVRWTLADERCSPQVVVEQVVQGSPAERAGLRTGDILRSIDGEAVRARLAALPYSLRPGDTVAIRLERQGRIREVTPVADRRPDMPPRKPGEAIGFHASSAPVVWTAGDTVVARNLDGARVRRPTGFWIASSDGGTEFRSLRGRSADALDSKVRELVECAARAEAPEAPSAPALRQILRADSLRVLFGRRALEAESVEDLEILLERVGSRAGVPSPPVPPGPPTTAAAPVAPPAGGYVFRIEGPLMAGLRSVAGAEVTELEPELAEYFRNARSGLLVLRVANGTPADRAGLRPGDVIVEGADRRVRTIQELRALLAAQDGRTVELEVVRKGRTRTVTLGRR